MLIRIQRGSSVPISRQIDAQIRAQILSGSLRPEDQLPSVRQLARELAVNVNTVARVYERLGAEKFIELRHGDGTYVASRSKRAVSSELTERRREFSRELDALVRRGLMLGITAAELSQRLAESIERARQDTSLVDCPYSRERGFLMNHPCAISIQHLRQGYGKQVVLNDVSLEIPHGQTFALLGRNGAGKTTLIRTLLGLMAPKSGAVEVLGLTPAIQPIEVRRRIGYLAEDQAMYGWMTAEELGRFLTPFYPTWDVRLANDLLDRFGVPRRTRIKHLSKGQNVRLGLALALSHQSEIVVLDDPTLGLDPISRKQFNRDVIEYLQAEKRTVFYSSHLLYEVEAVADAVGILDQGRIVRMGCTEDLQREIKRVVLPVEAAAKCPKPEKLLDVEKRRRECCHHAGRLGPVDRRLAGGRRRTRRRGFEFG